jgi:hypothetical protein
MGKLKDKLKKFVKNSGKAAAVAGTAYMASKMMGAKKPKNVMDAFTKKGMSLATGDASAADASPVAKEKPFFVKASITFLGFLAPIILEAA